MKHRSLKVREVAEALRLSANTVYERIKSGDIRAAKLFGEYRIPIEEIERLLAPSMSAEVSEDEAKDAGAVA